MKDQKGYVSSELIIIAIAVLMISGWIANIYKLASTGKELAEFGAIEILRIIGIFVAPLGSVLGFM